MKNVLKRTLILCALLTVTFTTTCFADDFSIIAPITPNTIDFDDSNNQDWTKHLNVDNVNNAAIQNKTEASDGAYYYTGMHKSNTTWGFRLFTPGNNSKTSLHNPIYGIADMSFDLMFSSTYYSVSTSDGPVVSLKNTDGKDLFSLKLRSFAGVSRITMTDGGNTSGKLLDIRKSYNTWYTYNVKVNIPKGTYTMTITKKGETEPAETQSGSLLSQNTKNLYCLNVQPLAADTGELHKVYLDNFSVKRETYVVGTPDIKFEDGTATATVTVQNEAFGEVISPQLIVGLYDDSNKLLNVNWSTMGIDGRGEGGTTTLKSADVVCSVATPAGKTASYAKAFVWNSIDGLKPYITPIEVSLAE